MDWLFTQKVITKQLSIEPISMLYLLYNFIPTFKSVIILFFLILLSSKYFFILSANYHYRANFMNHYMLYAVFFLKSYNLISIVWARFNSNVIRKVIRLIINPVKMPNTSN